MKLLAPLFIILLIACQPTIQPVTGTGRLIPVNFNDTNYSALINYATDTVTADGWTIKYLVKDDSTRYTDIYIQWAKGERVEVYKIPDVLTFRIYFIPAYLGENETHLFFEHGCATNCKALLALSKNSAYPTRDFTSIVDFNIENGQIVYISDSAYTTGVLKAGVVDLKKQIEKLVVFRNSCYALPSEGCIDSVHFANGSAELFATLVDKGDSIGVTDINERIKVLFSK